MDVPWTRSRARVLEKRSNKPYGGVGEDGRVRVKCYTIIGEGEYCVEHQTYLRVGRGSELVKMKGEHCFRKGWDPIRYIVLYHGI